MRRLLAIFLLFLLPLQSSWGAVVVYCEHESDAQAQHLGHHEHSHAGALSMQDAAMADDSTASTAGGVDCGHCHSSCCSVAALMKLPPQLAGMPHPVVLSDGTTRALAQTRPERPQWLPLA